ncbi:MAG: glycosyltransferase family 2 protein [Cyanobacteria bacterium J06600_6]
MLKTPVAFLIFNRPKNTQRVFDAIRKAQPAKLMVVADGHRGDRPGEAEKCAAAQAVIAGVDWDCEVSTNYSAVNLGCRDRVASGLNWVFEQVESAIILEDDCLPDPSFFPFCETLLTRYASCSEVMGICGSNFLSTWKSRIQSYHYSYYFNCWGWATWRRAWQRYDLGIKSWSKLEVKAQIANFIDHEAQFQSYSQAFDRNYLGKLNTWDFAFAFACLSHQGYLINSAVNLVSNLGFGEDATHTTANANHIVANLPRHTAQFPLIAPKDFSLDRGYTNAQYNLVWDLSWQNKIRRKLRQTRKKLSSSNRSLVSTSTS